MTCWASPCGRMSSIAAISTALGEAAVSVLRVSGPRAFEIVSKIARTKSPLQPRRIRLADIVDAEDHVIDHAMLLCFKGPASYTGEDVVEIHCHGGVLVTQRVLELLLAAGALAAGGPARKAAGVAKARSKWAWRWACSQL